jgi:hypothetical protein
MRIEAALWFEFNWILQLSRLTARAVAVAVLLQINHPLDCPICDQGGECDLQDQVGVAAAAWWAAVGCAASHGHVELCRGLMLPGLFWPSPKHTSIPQSLMWQVVG